MNKTNFYRFTTREERYKRMNQFFLIAVDLMFLIFLFYQIIQVIKPDKDAITTGWNGIVLILFCILNIVVFFCKKSSSLLKLLAATEVAIEVVILSIHPSATFLGLALVGVLCVLIPYYDAKMYNITLIVYAVLYTASQVFRVVTNRESFTANMLCTILITYALFIVLLRVGYICKKFSDHALASSEEQSSHLAQLMDEILDISHTIKEESDASSQTMDYLLESAQNTTNSMGEISASAAITAENIEEQTGMTQNIQEDISETMNRSNEMVTIATTSSQKIFESRELMKDLKTQSEQMAETNKQVTEAMSKLSNNTKEVETIAGIILNISNQTNLLALNASIESARAGEAGKGFAVVADQIRQLAEETRVSTKNITDIISELNKNADEVVTVIDNSVTAAENQNMMISTASKTFEELDTHMTALLTDINEIDSKIEHLSEANNRIVENITNLSATTQEVTAIADQTNELSQKNLAFTQKAKQALALIQENASRLDKYNTN